MCHTPKIISLHHSTRQILLNFHKIENNCIFNPSISLVSPKEKKNKNQNQNVTTVNGGNGGGAEAMPPCSYAAEEAKEVGIDNTWQRGRNCQFVV